MARLVKNNALDIYLDI